MIPGILSFYSSCNHTASFFFPLSRSDLFCDVVPIAFSFFRAPLDWLRPIVVYVACTARANTTADCGGGYRDQA